MFSILCIYSCPIDSKNSDRSSLIRATQSFCAMVNALLPAVAGKASTAQSASRVFSHWAWAVLILAVTSVSCDGFLP
ncbi:hypothetical protein D3C87_2028410 [compost metagenome]